MRIAAVQTDLAVCACDLQKPSVMKYSKICTGDEVISDDMIPQDPTILHVIISVYSIAFGLTRVEECKAATLDIAACLQLLPNRNDLIYQGISGVYFKVSNKTFLLVNFKSLV